MPAKFKTHEFRVIALAYASFIMLGASGSLLGIAWPSMQQQFGVSLDALGLLLLAPTTASLTVSFLSGRIIRRLGIAATLMTACLLLGLGLIAYGIAPSWLALIVLGALLGAGSGLLDSGMNAFFAESFGPRLMNWLHASFGVGATLGPILMTAMFSAGLSWEWGYIAVGVVTAAMSLLYVARRQDWALRHGSAAVDVLPASAIPPLRNTLRQPLVWVGILLFFLFAGVEITAGNWAYSLFTLARGVDTAQAGLWVSLYWGFFTIGRIVFGIFANRLNPAAAVRWCIVGATAGALLLWWNPVNTVGFFGLALLGFAQAPVFPLMISTTPQRLGRGHAANAIGFQIGSAGLGLTLAPGIAGVLAGAGGLEVIGPFLTILSLAAFVLYQTAGTRKIAPDSGVRAAVPAGPLREDARL
ncbi:MAG: MFS transporter [Chloroflexota bacterium]|nr:MAG: MFS transporter [Chloroflexota bacterium]